MEQLIALIAERNAAVYEWAAVVIGLVALWELVARRRLAGVASGEAGLSAEIPAGAAAAHMLARHWFMIFLAVVVVVRVLALDSGPYWYDEAFTVWVAQLPFERLLAAVAGDVHPPLWYALTWLWVRVVGVEPWLVRLLPAACSLLALPLAQRLAERLRLPPEVQYVGLWLLAFSRFELFYASDVRMYALMQALYLAGALCVLERRWGWLALVFALLLHTHYYGMFYCAVLGLLALAGEMRLPVHPKADPPWFPVELPASNLRAVIVAGGVALLTYLPWLGVLAQQMDAVSTGHWILPVSGAEVLLTFYVLLFHNGPLYLEAFGFVAATALTAFVSFKSLRYPLTLERATLLWLTIGPMLLAVIVSLVWHPVYVTRYLLPIAPTFFLLIGWAITYRVGWRARLALAVVLIPLLAFGAVTPDREMQMERGRAVEIATLVRAGWREGDVIIHTHPWTRVEMQQFAAPEWPQYLAPAPDGLALGGLTAQTRAAMGMQSARLADLPYRRAWVVSAFGPLILPEQRRQALADSLNGRSYELVQKWVGERQLYGVEVYRVEVAR